MRGNHWLEALHIAHYPTLLRLAQNRLRALTGSTSEAEDVVQDVFLLAAEKDISQIENPLGWLIKATSNLCMKRMDRVRRESGKKQRLIQHRLDQSADRSVYAVEREESETDALLSCLALEQALPEEDWELMRSYCLQGVPIEELSAQLHIPIGTLRVRICRIRKKLSKIRPDL